jgi:putative ATPase
MTQARDLFQGQDMALGLDPGAQGRSGSSDQVRGPGASARPLADSLRPQTLDDVVGQGAALAVLKNYTPHPPQAMPEATSPSRGEVKTPLPSLILWGPPGCGKTTIARILARDSGLHFEQISAIFSGVADLKKIFESAKIRAQNNIRTLLFVDEIHRFNKSQQDAFLPVVEDGTITLIGATTENPSFELNGALLSRAQVVVLNRLDDDALENIIKRAETHMGRTLPVDSSARATLRTLADGDGRYLLGLCEQIFAQTKTLDEAAMLALVSRRRPLYDKANDGHYNLISALHKSVRGSDPDAALYWFCRMLEGGDDPRFIARRVARMAVEDIGLADPNALTVALNAWDAYERMGSPEGELALSQAVIYMATAPKSNTNYTAFTAARASARDTGSVMPPKIILNAPTKLMEDQEYGTGYIYDHDTPEGFSGQNYFPDGMVRPNFYTPTPRGFEREIEKRLAYWTKLRAKRKT